MKRSQGEFVRNATPEEAKGTGAEDYKVQVIRVNGHERLLYSWKDSKPFVFPKPYPPVRKAPSDKYNAAKAMTTACANFVKAKDCEKQIFNGNGKPKCPVCGEKAVAWGFTYAVCGNGCTTDGRIFAF